jgi:hypothetical protein
MTHKNGKKSRIFMFLSTGCSLLRAEGFSFSLGLGRPLWRTRDRLIAIFDQENIN